LKQPNNQGFALLEVLASVLIITLILTTSITILVTIQRNTSAANDKIKAIEVGTRVRDELVASVTYAQLHTWLDSPRKEVTIENIDFILPPFNRTIFTNANDQYPITLIFNPLGNRDYTRFRLIKFEIIIEYFPNRFLTLEGVIYE